MKPTKYLEVLPECYVDTNLIEYLLNAHVNHQHSCTKVVGQLNTTFRDRFAIGIIDKDKVEMGYIKECDVIASTEHLTLLKHKKRNQYLITIRPAVDGFILDNVKATGINLDEFKLPSKLKDFTKVSKSVNSNTDHRFKSLFESLITTREFRNLKTSLEYMLEQKYRIDDDKLIKLFENHQ